MKKNDYYITLMNCEAVENWFDEKEIPIPIDILNKYVMEDGQDGNLYIATEDISNLLTPSALREIQSECITYITRKNIVHELIAN
jgi:hypothetical protein